MARVKKITIIGNSVALRVRPPVEKANYNYGTLLEIKINEISDEPWIVLNKGFGRATTKEVLIRIDDFINTFPEIFIINMGAVDAPSREIPLWYSDIIYGRRKSLFSFFLIKLYMLFIIRGRRFFTFLRFKKSWVSNNEFLKNIESIISAISKDTNAQILILGINKGNERMENILPGTIKKYIEYSRSLKGLAKEQNIPFISVDDLSDREYFPDGVHYNKKGHMEIADRIMNVFEMEFGCFKNK